MSSRARVNLTLLAVVVLLAATCLVGALAVDSTRRQRADEAVEQQRYADVLAAATAEAEAFINIRYDDAQRSIDAVVRGATGEFRDRYDSSTSDVLRVLQRHRSVMDGRVVWAGVADIGPDTATVVAATTGTVANVTTDGRPVAREFRLRLELVRRGDTWLTSDLESVR